MGTHKHDSLGRKLKKFFFPRYKLMTAKEAASYRQVLAEMYRSRFALSMHPLQTSYSVVPPAEVIDKVQGSSKADANTFLGSGYRVAIRILEELQAHGYDIAGMDRMLEFGFGTGRVLLHFLPFRVRRYGCDVNPAALEWTSGILGKFADLGLSNPEPPLPYDNDFFDLVIAMSVFTHIPLNAQRGWVAELGRVLKPGGCVVATVHEFSKMGASQGNVEWGETGVDRGLHMNSYLTRQKLEEIWSTAFDVLEVRRFPPGQAHIIARRKVLG